MTTPAEYREFAIDCMRLAEQEEIVELRDTMMGLARARFRTAIMMDQHVPTVGDDLHDRKSCATRSTKRRFRGAARSRKPPATPA